MKLFRFTFLLLSCSLFAQQETEIYLIDLYRKADSIAVKNVSNISNNPGYDSQPSFLSNEQLIYAGTQNNQTEIMMYDLQFGNKSRVNKATTGGEYSPQKFPSLDQLAAVRLDPDGLQQLYSYKYNDSKALEEKPLITAVSVAYFAFHDNNNIVASILADDKLVLVKANLSTKKIDTITSNVGRSIHKVPGTDNVSYTSVNEDGIHEVYIIDILGDNESYYVCDLPIGIQDHCWLTDSELLLGSGSKLYTYDLFGNTKWEEIADLSSYKISEINRITVSPDKSKIALVASIPIYKPGAIVDAHIKPFNEERLDAFSEAFSEDVLVKRFPADTTQVGRQELRDSYQSFFKKNKSVHVSVVNRIIHNDWVIDEEEVLINDKKYSQVTLYKTSNGLISEMTFLERKRNNNPEAVVDKQLEGYNTRDIDAFMKPFGKNVLVMRYPDTVLFKGRKAARVSYAAFFENTPDLNVTIKNRIINGNKVIDQEQVLMNGKMVNAVAIYEVEKDKIVKVTFLPLE